MKRWFSLVPVLGGAALLAFGACEELPTETATTTNQPIFKKGEKPGGGVEEPPPDPAILFSTRMGKKYRNLGVSIHVMNADGSNVTPVLDDNLEDGAESFDPQWAPDGERFVFRQSVDGRDQITTANVDGTGFVVLQASQASSLEHPRWSPVALGDGQEKIAYVEIARPATSGSILVVANADGSGRTELVRLPTEYVLHLEWSRLGDRIAATVWNGEIDQSQHTLRLYDIVCSAAACGSTGYTNVDLSSGPNGLSPDDCWSVMDWARMKDVIVTSVTPGCGSGGSDFYTFDFSGDPQQPVVTQLTTTGQDQDGATWSADDSQIAYTVFTGRTRNAFVMNADGTGEPTDLGAKTTEVVLDWKR